MALATQVFPYPDILQELLDHLEYREGWTFKLRHMDRGQDSSGLTLVITTRCIDAYHPEHGNNYSVKHFMPVPPAAFDEQSWRRWLLEQVLLVERHEACEFFKIGGKRPYAPHHGMGEDPYIIFDRGTDAAARTRYTERAPAEDIPR